MKQYRANDRETAGQAAEWLHSIRTGEAREREGFAAWLLESRRNVRAALLTIAVEKELEQIDPQRQLDVDAMLAEADGNVVPLANVPSPGRRGRARVGASLAAALATIAIAWTLWNVYAPKNPVFATATGQQQSVKLDDGSVVHLNTQSRIEVDFNGQGREVRLLAGEALFDVQRDAVRPFQVRVGKTLVRALGTQFNVDRHAAQVTVAVLEGRVEVRNGNAVAEILDAGEEAQIVGQGNVENRVTPNVRRHVAWRERRLEFQDDSLSSVVAEFNRYNRAPRLRIADAGLGSRTYTGLFSADDPDSLAKVLAEEQDLSVERSPEEIVIRARPR